MLYTLPRYKVINTNTISDENKTQFQCRDQWSDQFAALPVIDPTDSLLPNYRHPWKHIKAVDPSHQFLNSFTQIYHNASHPRPPITIRPLLPYQPRPINSPPNRQNHNPNTIPRPTPHPHKSNNHNSRHAHMARDISASIHHPRPRLLRHSRRHTRHTFQHQHQLK